MSSFSCREILRQKINDRLHKQPEKSMTSCNVFPPSCQNAESSSSTDSASFCRFTCNWNECGKRYQSSEALRHHKLKKNHCTEAEAASAAKKLMCPLASCRTRFSHMAGLCHHVQQQHEPSHAGIETITFSTIDEFNDWKTCLEDATTSSFVQHEGEKLRKGKTYINFYCNRSGQACKRDDAVRNKLRSTKRQGLSKIHGTCTAHISRTVHVQPGEVKVRFCRQHFGHSLDLCHIRLSQQIRSEVAALLQQGATVNDIMDSVHDGIGPLMHRDNLLCRRDVNNIRRAYHCSCGDVAVGCKHARNVLRDRESIDAIPVEPAVVYIQSTEVPEHIHDMELYDDTSAVDGESSQLDSVCQQSQLELQQCIIDVSVCNDPETLLCTLRQASAAHENVYAAAKHRAVRRTARKRQPTNRKLDGQLCFCSTEAKQQACKETIDVPLPDKLTGVEQQFVGQVSGAEPDAVMQTVFFVDAECDVPYCVHSEEVSTESCDV